MSWRTNRAVLALRTLGRALGLNSRLATLLWGRNYEDRFQVAMLRAIREGDVVWDVGANVGFYAKKFSDIAGSSGKVFAYEPSPTNLQRLHEAVASLRNVTVVPLALGEREDVLVLEQGNDPLGATSRIIDKTIEESERQITIQVSSGDQLISSGVVLIPNIIKIDTEGYELDVLHGLTETLRQKELRTLCIEVHFGLLKERGLPNASSDIEKLLVHSGFALAWPDASHVVATRIM